MASEDISGVRVWNQSRRWLYFTGEFREAYEWESQRVERGLWNTVFCTWHCNRSHELTTPIVSCTWSIPDQASNPGMDEVTSLRASLQIGSVQARNPGMDKVADLQATPQMGSEYLLMGGRRIHYASNDHTPMNIWAVFMVLSGFKKTNEQTTTKTRSCGGADMVIFHYVQGW